MHVSLTQRLAGVAILTIVLIGLVRLADAPLAGAATLSPFGITSFTMQTTAPTEEIEVPYKAINGLNETGVEFINRPYQFTQAGGHPWALTTTLEFTTKKQITTEHEVLAEPTQEAKDIVVNLPPGLVGDPVAVPSCPLALLGRGERCPADTQIGVWHIYHGADNQLLAPIVNVTPEAGQSAEFAFENSTPLQTPLLAGHLVHTAQGYGLTVASNSLPNLGTYRVETTFWGVPGDPSHDRMRGLFCRNQDAQYPMACQGGNEPFGSTAIPFLTLGTDCSAGPQTATLRVDSWEEPGSVGPNGVYTEQWKTATTTMPGLTGCDLLGFAPRVAVEPDTLLADEPVGLGVDVQVPQSESPTAAGTPDLRDATVTLPEGVSVSPGVVDGIRACNATGPEGINIPPKGACPPTPNLKRRDSVANSSSRPDTVLTPQSSAPQKRSRRCSPNPSRVTSSLRGRAAAEQGKRPAANRMRSTGISTSSTSNSAARARSATLGSISR
jgi:hypothetical protein